MILEVVRFKSGPRASLGLWFDCTFGRRLLCSTLEDQFRFLHEKVAGETRIPAGTYRLQLRKRGGFHQRYMKRFPRIHKGMIEICDVPNFRWVMFHCGNGPKDTAGCPLVGDGVTGTTGSRPMRLTGSVVAYKQVYPSIAAAIETGNEVLCRFTDLDMPTWMVAA